MARAKVSGQQKAWRSIDFAKKPALKRKHGSRPWGSHLRAQQTSWMDETPLALTISRPQQKLMTEAEKHMMWYRLLFSLAVIYLLFACEPTLKRVEQTDTYGYRSVATIDPKTGKKTGILERFDPGGSLVERAHYQDDLLDGPRILFSATGDTILVEHYALTLGEYGEKAAVFSGPYRAFYEPEGQLRNKGQYVNNAMAGIWYRYYPNGQAAEAVTFRDNEEDGPFREWHENGQLKAAGTYQPGGKEEGELRLYNEQGQLQRVMQCSSGICRTRWHDEQQEPPPPDNLLPMEIESNG